jgi:micrococcal nuclease
MIQAVASTPTPSRTPQVTPTPEPTPAPNSGSGGEIYVGNSNSKIFHTSGCSWGKKISPEHRVEFNSKEEAIAKGYSPCEHCKP